MSFASSLRHRVKIYVPLEGESSDGQPLVGRTLFAERWADIVTTGGLEAIKAGAVTSSVKASIRLRYCTDLSATMEIDHGTTTYRVLAVLPDQRSKRHVDLVCEITQ